MLLSNRTSENWKLCKYNMYLPFLKKNLFFKPGIHGIWQLLFIRLLYLSFDLAIRTVRFEFSSDFRVFCGFKFVFFSLWNNDISIFCNCLLHSYQLNFKGKSWLFLTMYYSNTHILFTHFNWISDHNEKLHW